MTDTLDFNDLIKNPLTSEELLFFNQYEHAVVGDLILKKTWTPRQKLILIQIGLRQQIQSKLPTFYANKNCLYANKINVEQCSSEKTANFKASLVRGRTFIDLTTGMGVDSLAISAQFENGILIEQNESLAKITAYNLNQQFQKSHLQVLGGAKAEAYLTEINEQVDLIYLDPARRDSNGGKVVQLNDCEPNAIQLLDILVHKGKNILIKTSPLLDIELACKQLKYHVSDVYAVASNHECKELLFLLNNTQHENYKIHAVNLDDQNAFEATKNLINNTEIKYSEPLQYVYEPYVSLMKTSLHNVLTQHYPIFKLHPNSHLFTSEKCIDHFPGRVFKLNFKCKPNKKDIEKYVPTFKANITIRNFPGTVNELRKKLNLKEGGEQYLFATTLLNNEKVLLGCSKIN
jgi:16S rRNA G966 N2-methylase RsmD